MMDDSSSFEFPFLIGSSTPEQRKAIPTFKRLIVPIAQIRVRSNDGTWSHRFPVMIDSGAMVSVFPAEICEDLLGSRVEDGAHLALGTAGSSSVDVFVHEVDVHIGNKILHNVPIGFRLERQRVSILGRFPFFEYFDIEFHAVQLKSTFKSR